MRQGQYNGFSTICGDVCVGVRVSPECVRNPPIVPLWDENAPDVTWARSEGKPPRGIEGLRSGQGNFLLSVNSQSCQRGVRNVGCFNEVTEYFRFDWKNWYRLQGEVETDWLSESSMFDLLNKRLVPI